MQHVVERGPAHDGFELQLEFQYLQQAQQLGQGKVGGASRLETRQRLLPHAGGSGNLRLRFAGGLAQCLDALTDLGQRLERIGAGICVWRHKFTFESEFMPWNAFQEALL